MGTRLPRKLSAILYADVADYSRLTGEDEDATHLQLGECLDLIAHHVQAYRGQVMHYAGDAVLAMFAAVYDAVECALEIQRQLAEHNASLPDRRRLMFRIGVNLGDVIEDRGDIYGDGVNIAARLEALADPGGICVSEAVRTAIGRKLVSGFEDLGAQQVKNIEAPVRAYRVIMDPGQAPIRAGGTGEVHTGKTPDKPSIAVLPFTNLSRDKEQEYLADGISEDLITALSRIHWFFVIARYSSFSYKGEAADVTRIASELGVRYVIEGSVRKSGDRIRISAQLIDATTGHHVWAETYSRDLQDIFEVQDDMAQTIAGAVEPELSAAERERAVCTSPENLGAWEIYQRGLWHLWNFNRDDMAEAQRLFQQVHQLDPGFSPAYSFESYSHYLDTMLGFSPAPEQSLALAHQAARTALARDDKDPAAYFAMGRVCMMQGKHDDSVAALSRAIELSPSFALAHHGLGFALVLSGRPEEGADELDKAMRLSPRDPVLWGTKCFRSIASCQLQEYDEAEKWARAALNEPRSAEGGYWPFAVLASALANLDQLSAAREAIDEALRRKPGLSLGYLKSTLPTRHPEDLAIYFRGLLKAGLAE